MTTRLASSVPLRAFGREAYSSCAQISATWPQQISTSARQPLRASLQSASAILDSVADADDRYAPMLALDLPQGTLDVSASERRPGVVKVAASMPFSLELPEHAPPISGRPAMTQEGGFLVNTILVPDFIIAFERDVFAAHIGEQGIELSRLLQLPAGVSAIVAPITEWSEAVADDLVRDELLAAFDEPTPWNMLAAAGAVLRWEPIPYFIEGESGLPRPLPGVRDQVQQWAGQLDADQLRTALEYVRAEATLLYEELSELATGIHPADDAWLHRMHDVCMARAQLECVLEVVPLPWERNAEWSFLRETIEDVDELGDQLVAQFAAPPMNFDPRLLREGIAAPLSWWTALVPDGLGLDDEDGNRE